MKIQQTSTSYIQQSKIKTKKVSNPFTNRGLQSDVVSFSSKKSKKAGFLKTLAVSLGALTMLTGCGGENQNRTKNIDTKSGYEYSISDTNCTDNNKKAAELGIKLLKHGENLDYATVEKEINNFFKENGITNVEIKDISKSPEIPSNLMGAFIPQYNDLEYCGGSMYIGKPKNFTDEKQRLKYAEEVSHELTHVLQFQNDNTTQGLKEDVNSQKEADIIFKAVNDFKQTQIVNYARNAALSDYVLNSMTQSEYNSVVNNINKYGMAFYEEEIDIKPGNVKNAVVETLSGDSTAGFEQTVNSITDEYLNTFVSKYGIDESKQEQMKKALLSNIIFNYKAEAEAYRTSTAVEEYSFGISGDSLSDFVPDTYDEIAKVLEKKYTSEYGN